MQVGVKTKTRRRFKLVKWDMERAPEEMVKEPEKDPRCAEIIEWELGGPKRITYKRK